MEASIFIGWVLPLFGVFLCLGLNGSLSDIAMLYDIWRRTFSFESSKYGRRLCAEYGQTVFSRGAPLKMEFDEFYNAFFTNVDTYVSAVRLLSENKSGMTREDTVKATGLHMAS